jgi:N-acetyl-anhydromuramyl-L-alanine amidase AmpD
MRRIDFVVLHHSGGTPTASSTDVTGEQRFEVIKKDQHNRAVQQGWGENYVMDYHFVIGQTGIIFKGQPMEQVAFHCANYQTNLTSLGICFLGDFEMTKPTDAQIKAGINKIVELVNLFGVAIDHIKKHNDFVATDCPGKNFPFNAIISEVKKMVLKEPTEFDKAFDLMVRLGVYQPYGDLDTYKDKLISRRELAVILARVIEHQGGA